MYIDPFLIIDVACLLSATRFDGEGPHDGMLGIHCLIQVGDKARHICADYPDAATRDAAFLALGAAVQAMQAATNGALTLDLDA